MAGRAAGDPATAVNVQQAATWLVVGLGRAYPLGGDDPGTGRHQQRLDPAVSVEDHWVGGEVQIEQATLDGQVVTAGDIERFEPLEMGKHGVQPLVGGAGRGRVMHE